MAAEHLKGIITQSMRTQKNIDLKKYTTAGVGGPAKYFCTVSSIDKMIEAVNWTKKQKIPYFILGNGSNVLISDNGFPGLVIKNNIKGIIGFKQIIKVGTGTLLSELVITSVRQKLSGLQKLIGIPGTVGGAIYGNAGAYGTSISDHLTKIVALDPESEKIIILTRKQCEFDYRESIFKKKDFIILEAHFKLTAVKRKTPAKQMKEILKQRAAKNFWEGKSPGSFFKNIQAEKISEDILKTIPKEKIIHNKIPAGFILENVGAKNQQIGDVKVSKTHANLLINIGNGTSADFCALAKKLMKLVKEKYNIVLEPEVQLINLPPLQVD